MKKKLLAGLATGLFLVGMVGMAEATMIDFQTGSTSGAVTETGYTAVTATPQTVEGVTFTFTNAFFDRNPGTVDSGTFTYADLYNDFAYSNFGDPLTLSMSGLAASTNYDIRFYSSDRFNYDRWADAMTNTFTATTGSGSAVSVTWDRTLDPTSNKQNSVLGAFTSSNTGVLSFKITGTLASGTGYLMSRLNGLDINQATPVPVPGTMLLFGTGIAGLAGFNIRRKKKA